MAQLVVLPGVTTVATLDLVGTPDPAAAAQATTSQCYAVADNGDYLYVVDRPTGTLTYIGPTGTSAIESIAVAPGGGVVYATNGGQFGQLDLNTGAFSAIGPGVGTGTSDLFGTRSFNDIDGLHFETRTGILYGTDRDSNPARDALLQIDPVTGRFVPDAFGPGRDFVEITGVTATADIDDIASDPEFGLLYGVANAGGNADRLVVIDKVTGVSVEVDPASPQAGPTDIEGLSFFNDGSLYGSTGAGGNRANHLVRLNKLTGKEDPTYGTDPGYPLAITPVNGGPTGTDWESLGCETDTVPAPSTISGTVFEDLDGDALLDAGEPRQPDVAVRLYIDNNDDGLVDASDTLISTKWTDVNGFYTWTTWELDNYVIDIDMGDLPPLVELSTGNNEVAQIPAGGTNEVNNDFGFIYPPDLDIVKTSDASQPLAAGDRITYTIVVPNTTSGAQTNLQLTDVVPTGSTYVPGSGQITYSPPSATYADDFSAQVFDGSDGSVNWTPDPWVPSDDKRVEVLQDGTESFAVRIERDGEWIDRPFDASGPFASGLVSWDYRHQDAGGDTRFLVELSDDGGSTWTTLRQYNGGGTTPYARDFAQIPAAMSLTNNMVLRFNYDNEDGGEVWFDDVEVRLFRNTITEATDPPPTLAPSSGQAIEVAPGASVTWTFQVDVNLIPVVSSVDNTASVVSDQQTTPSSSQVSDPVQAVIGDFLWFDRDADGIQDAGEPGLNGFTVNLLDGSGNPVLDGSGNPITTTTANNPSGGAPGWYRFDRLAAGTYILEFPQLVNTFLSPKDVGASEAVDSDVDPTTQRTDPITVAAGDTLTNVDAGVYILTSVGDKVFNDFDRDGIQDAGEPGIQGVTVNLLDNNGVQLQTTTTNASGIYGFADLVPGQYRIEVVPPAGFSHTLVNQGGNDAVDSDVFPGTGQTANFSLFAGSARLDVDAGLHQGADLGDRVFRDRDRDGIQDAGEPGIPGVTVQLLDAAGVFITSTVTNASGDYLFTDLPPANYRVRVLLPTGATVSPVDQGGNDALDSDIFPGTNTTNLIAVADGVDDLTVDAGLWFPSIGDKVFDDRDHDGIQDAGEPGIDGVVVNLLDSAGNPTGRTTTTAGGGLYLFEDVLPGNWIVEFVQPAGSTPSPQNVGGNDAVDSDASPTTGRTGLIAVATGSVITDVDAGFYFPAAIGDRVFLDLNDNGLQDAGPEVGLSGVTVNLLDNAGNPVLDGGVPVTTTTDGNGDYRFSDLVAGTYRIEVVLPADHAFSPQNAGADTLDSDVDPATGISDAVSVADGVTDLTVDAGVVPLGSIGDLVFEDVDGDGQQGGTEPGVGGVTANLLDDFGNPVLDGAGNPVTTVTAPSGAYQFTGLRPGDYRVEFVAPAGWSFTTPNIGPDATDSDAVPGAGQLAQTGTFSVAAGQDRTDVDAGIYRPATIGDLVWNDINRNGVRNFLEPGLAGLTVRLLDGSNNVLATTTTSLAGAYQFTGLAPGTYRIEVVTPLGFTVTTANAGGDDTVDSDILSAPGVGRTGDVILLSNEVDDTVDAGFRQGADIGDYVWNDLDRDGLQGAGEPAIANVQVELKNAAGTVLQTTTTDASGNYLFTDVAAGTYTVAFTPATTDYIPTLQNVGGSGAANNSNIGSDGETQVIVSDGVTNLTIDAGFYRNARIADFVWDDLDRDGIQDAGEDGIQGVVVNLLDAGTLAQLDTTTTDNNGLYEFATLRPGNYVIEVELAGVAANARVTLSNVGSGGTPDANDSDLTDLTVPGVARTGVVTLVDAEDDDTVDAGLYFPASIGDFVWNDLDADGQQDAGEPGLDNVTVRLLDAAVPTTVVATTLTSGGGAYLFEDLFAGDYIVEVVAPPGGTISPQDQGNDATDSDVDPATGRSADVTVAAEDVDLTVDAGIYFPAGIGNLVFLDLNDNGVQDGGAEVGVPNVTVTLLDAAGDPTGLSALTDADGLWFIPGVVAGTYQLEFGLPADHAFSPADQGGDDTLDSDVTFPATGRTDTFTVVAGATDNSRDAGLVPLGSIGSFVFEDVDGDGLQGGSEPGIDGVTVRLLDGSGTPIPGATTTTNNGDYLFAGLRPGNYIVEFVAPAGLEFATVDVGGDDAVDSDADPATGRTGVIALAADEDDDTVDAGLYTPAEIGDYVWNDVNRDGIQDGGEPPLSGVAVQLLDGAGAPIAGATDTTDVNGLYGFTGLKPGTYRVRFTIPAGFVTTDADQGADDEDSDAVAAGAVADTGIVTLVSGEVDDTVDAGFRRGASVGDFVWNDLDRDGVQDASEPGVENVLVELLLGNTVIDTDTTDVNGAYLFTDVAAEDYTLRFTPPAGYLETALDAGGDDTADSDLDGGEIAITVVDGVTDLTFDAGYYREARIGNFVWDDVDRDGQQTGGEPGIDGVVVNLLDASDPANLVQVDTTTTDGTGFYEFTGLMEGDYVVEVVLPAGTVKVTDPNLGADLTDSDLVDTTVPGRARTAIVTVTDGQDDLTVDGGLYFPAVIGDFVWNDLDGDGIQDAGEPGLAGVTVRLLDAAFNPIAGLTTSTDANGLYLFDDLLAGTYVVEVVPAAASITTPDAGGDTVDSDVDQTTGRAPAVTLALGEEDRTIDAGLFFPAGVGDRVFLDLNGDGIQDGAEPGVENIVVNLVDAGGNTVATDTTDVNGNWFISGFVAGTYRVEFVLPASGYVFSPALQGGDTTGDSNVTNPATGRTDPLVLSPGSSDATIDAGLVPLGSIGDRVFEDVNGDEVQDAGDVGLAGITVRLLDDGTGATLATTTTADGTGIPPLGFYEFTDLEPGNYRIQVVAPAGYEFVTGDVGADDTVDSDVVAVAGSNGDTATVALAPTVGDPFPAITDVDAGLVRRGQIGNFVWNDLDRDGVQDAGEPGIVGATVNLLDATNPAAPVFLVGTTTNGTGAYSFTNLLPGDYIVEFITPAGGFQRTTPDQGGNDVTDSDASLGLGRTPVITLVSGQIQPTWDAGFFRDATIGDFVWNDLDRDGVQDGGEPGLGGVTVELLRETSPGVFTLQASTTTADGTGIDPLGSYAFGGLPPGTYRVRIVPPAGSTVTTANAGGNDNVDSDVLPATNTTGNIVLVDGTSNATVDAGVWFQSSIGNFIWDDQDRDGVQGGTEPGLADVTVNLLDATDPGNLVLVATTTTADGTGADPLGFYEFDGLTLGDYVVEVVLPAQAVTTLADAAAATDLTDSDLTDTTTVPGRARTDVFTLADDTDDPTIDGGLYFPATIGDFVWDDRDHDGVQDAGEPGIAGVTVRLLDADNANALVATTTTGDGTTAPLGSYTFADLFPGNYVVEVVKPATATFSPRDAGGDDALDSDVDPTTGRTAAFAAAAGAVITTVDAGYYLPASIGNRVFLDLDDDGVQDGGLEVGVSGVTVRLLDGTGTPIPGRTTTTDVNGDYLFSDLTAGTYRVEFVLPADHAFSPKDALAATDATDSDADPVTGRTDDVVLVDGQVDDSVDAGVVPLGSISGQVFTDANGNGLLGAGEGGLDAVTVNVYDSGGTLVATVNTFPFGTYTFTGLRPDTYTIEVVPPAGYVITQQDAGDDTLDSDVSPVDGRVSVPIAANQDVSDIDAGLYVPAMLGDRVWNDLDRDGVQDPGEPGLAGVTVNLLDATNAVIATVVTADGTGADPIGHYEFTNIVPGNRRVEVVTPAGFTRTLQDQGGNDALDSDLDPATGRTSLLAIRSADDIDNVDAGFFRGTSVGNFVWNDLDRDGVQDGTEPGIDGVLVELVDGVGNVVRSATTAGGGAYTLTDVPPGAYTVRFTPPANGVVTAQDAAAATDLTDSDIDASSEVAVTVVDGVDDLTVDAGYFFEATLGNFVWDDQDRDGIQDGTEPGIAGVTVRLLDADNGNALVATTTTGDGTTDPLGQYEFTGLRAGNYVVEVVLPAGTAVTTPDEATATEATDSDLVDTTTIPGSALTATVALADGATNRDVDGGLYFPASIGDFVFLDIAGDGIFNGADFGLPGATVRLLDAGGNEITTTVTNGSGAYTFGDLAPGTYIIKLDAPAGGAISPKDVGGNDAIDSDFDPITGRSDPVTVVAGQNVTTVDGGVFQSASIGNFVWNDLDRDGIQDAGEPGLAGATVELLDGPGGSVLQTIVTPANGAYQFSVDPGTYVVRVTPPANALLTTANVGGDDTVDSDAAPGTGETAPITVASNEANQTVDIGIYRPGLISDLVFYDTNRNGVRDGGELGIAGVTVNLLDGAGNPTGTSTVTDANGIYAFDGLFAGDHIVEVVRPTDAIFSPKDAAAATEATDSDVDPATGRTDVITLVDGERRTDVDAGAYVPVAIGDRIFDDLDADGIQDVGEGGVAGAEVRLLDAGLNVIATQTTDGAGNYLFDGLFPGTYSIEVVVPAGGQVSPQDATVDTDDSDLDPTTARTAPITLLEGQRTVDVDGGLFFFPAGLGNRVFADLDADGIQDAGEPGLAGVFVKVFNTDGSPAFDVNSNVLEMTTLADGTYFFPDVVGGFYTIRFTLPAGHVLSPDNVGGDDTVDSDPDPTLDVDGDPSTLETAVFEVVGGVNDLTRDAGFIPLGSIGDRVFEDLDADGVQDGGLEVGRQGVTVTLLDGAGNQAVDAYGVPVPAQLTDLNGQFLFTDLLPGDYLVEVDGGASLFSPQDAAAATEATDSDVDPTTGRAAVTLAAGTTADVDAGLYDLGSIGDLVFSDTNRDGSSAGEPGIPGIVVNLLDATGATPLATDTTDVNGLYDFPNLTPGDYVVEVEVPASWTVTTQDDATAGDLLDSDIDPATGRTATVTITSGLDDTSVDAGLVRGGTIGDLVFNDLDRDGIQDAGEGGVGGVRVNLLNAAGAIVEFTDTAPDGTWSFGDLPAGNYRIQIVPPAGSTVSPLDANANADDTVDSDVDPADLNRTVVFALGDGEVNLTVDAGVWFDASIGNRVFEDVNRDGLQDAGDLPVVGMTVNLLDSGGNPVLNGGVPVTTTTDASGNYVFDGLLAGNYVIEFVPPAGAVFTSPNVGADDTVDSDAAPADGQTSTIVLADGQDRTDVDAGIYVPSSIGDFVFDDRDGDDVQSGADVPVQGATVQLLDADNADAVVATTTTDAFGGYLFDDLFPGNYKVRVAIPAGAVAVTQGAGTDTALDSDIDATGTTGVIALGKGDMLTDVDAGLFFAAGIGDRVFSDDNDNGLQDAGELGIPGVLVTLLDGTGTPTGRTDTTDATGNYFFDNLTAGDYILEFALPADHVVATPDVGTDDAVDSDIAIADRRTGTVTLGVGATNLDVDAGFVPLGSLAGLVFDDLAADGESTGDPGVDAVVVNLRDATGATIVATTNTAPDGSWSFTGLRPADYVVEVVAPGGTVFTVQDVNGNTDDTIDSDVAPATGRVGVTLPAGADLTDIDAGLVSPATLGDRVFNDRNRDGLQTAGEPGIPGIVVRLMDGATQVATTTTDASGLYTFTGVTPGSYEIEVVVPAGWTVTALDANGNVDDTVDSDLVAATSRIPVTAVSATVDTTNDAGLYRSASIGDRVFNDLDRDGVQDAGEPGIQGVLVTLYDGTGAPTGATATTDASGNYTFADLPPGDYQVGFQTPPGGTATLEGVGAEATDSDLVPGTGRTAVFTLNDGQVRTNVDAGFHFGATIGDFVWDDLDRDGLQTAGEPGIANVTVNLLDAGGNVIDTTTTDVNGLYDFGDLVAGTYGVQVVLPTGGVFTEQDANANANDLTDSDVDVATGTTANFPVADGASELGIDAGVYFPSSIGDLVFRDLDADGIQDAGEVGLPGIDVELLDAGGAVVDTTTTDANGAYSFEDLFAGTYQVRVVLVGGETASPQDATSDDLDSDIDATGTTASIVLGVGEVNTDVDAGLFRPVGIGDLVFADVNDNGIQDAGEVGIDGVELTLYDAGGNAIATTTSAGGGAWSFTGIVAGDYTIGAALPAGFAFSPGMQGGDTALDSNIVPATGRSNTITIAAGAFDDTVDVGLVELGEVGDLVFEDVNGNGLRDLGEPGVAGVTVELFDTAGNLVDSAVTDANGNYLIADVRPGDYTVEVLEPLGTVFTTPGGDSDVALDGRAPVTVVAGQAADVDAGVFTPVTIGDRVFNDQDRDGLQDPAEPGIVGATVDLVDAAGNVVATTPTDANGNYSFTGLAPGTYGIVVTPPAGFVATTPDAGADDVDSDVDATGTSPTAAYGSGDATTDLDAGFRLSGDIGDFVWNDLDRDGVQDAGEPGIAGLTVDLLDAAGTVIDTTTTDADGLYAFTDLPTGQYRVQVEIPTDATVTVQDVAGNTQDLVDSDIDAAGVTDLFTLGDGASQTGMDAGFHFSADIGDFVWNDLDRDGLQTAGEPGIVGATVELLDAGGGVVATTTTDASGLYGFGNLVAGTYEVRVTLPTGGTFTTQDANANADDLVDSDVDASGLTGLFPVADGATDLGIDAGIWFGAELSGRVFEDLDADGVQDAGEPGIANVPVDLLDAAGAVIASTTTDVNGDYEFLDLFAGDYRVQVGVPVGATTSPQDAAADDVDSDVDAAGLTATITLLDGQVNDTTDAGVFYPAGIGDLVFADVNDNGVQDAGEVGVPNVVVELENASGSVVQTTTTDANGNYFFPGVVAGDYTVVVTIPAGWVASPSFQGGDTATDSNIDAAGRSDLVTLPANTSDTSVDAGLVELGRIGDVVFEDVNGNGLRDAGEPGVAGVTVNLFDDAGNPLGTTTTDPNGLWEFDGLRPGDYEVEVVLPAGTAFTIQDAGDDAIDSDVDPATGRAVVTLAAGQDGTSTYAGIYTPATIGDLVFNDLDRDGVQAAGEPGVPTVAVNLVDAGGNVVDTTSTDANGNYTFTGVAPGTYEVEVVAPPTWQATTPNQGGDDALDSDIDPATGRAPVTVVSGDVVVDTDGGLFRSGSIGDRVFEDDPLNGINGIQDPGESGVAGVTVNLLDATGAVVATTTTDGAGNYLFTGLVPGTYAIQVVLPSGADVVPVDQGGDDALDSDVTLDPSSTTASSAPFTLGDGQVRDDVDAGIYFLPAGLGNRVWEDTDGNGIQDPGEPGIPGATVNLYDGTGALVGTTTTAADGTFLFRDLPAGDYVLEFPAVTTAGWTRSPVGAGTDVEADSDAGLADGRTPTITVAAAINDLSWDAGFVPPTPLAPITGVVFVDADSSGTQDPGEGGLSGVQLQVWLDDGDAVFEPGTDDTLVETVTTAGDGSYATSPHPIGQVYWVDVVDTTLPAGASATTNDPQAVLLPDTGAEADFGYTLPAPVDPPPPPPPPPPAQPQLTLTNQGSQTVVGNGEVVYGHVIGNPSTVDDVVDVTLTSTEGFPVVVWIDTNGDGVVDPGVDTPITGPVDLPAGASVPVLVVVTVPVGTPDGVVDVTTITVTSTVDPAVSQGAQDVTSVVNPKVTLTNEGAETVVGSGDVLYGHVIGNPGPVDVTVDVTLVSDQGFPVEVWIDVDGDGAIDRLVDTLITGPIEIPAGGEVAVLVRVVVPEGTPEGTVDTTTITVTPVQNPAAAVSAVDVTTVTLGLAKTPDVTVTKSASPVTDVRIGEVITWTIVITNNDDVPRTRIFLSDDLPGDVLYVDGTTFVDGVAVPDVDGTTALARPYLLPQGLAPGGSVVVTLSTMVVSIPASGSIENVARVLVGDSSCSTGAGLDGITTFSSHDPCTNVLTVVVSDAAAVNAVAAQLPELPATGPADEPAGLALGALLLLGLGALVVTAGRRRRDDEGLQGA